MSLLTYFVLFRLTLPLMSGKEPNPTFFSSSLSKKTQTLCHPFTAALRRLSMDPFILHTNFLIGNIELCFLICKYVHSRFWLNQETFLILLVTIFFFLPFFIVYFSVKESTNINFFVLWIDFLKAGSKIKIS